MARGAELKQKEYFVEDLLSAFRWNQMIGFEALQYDPENQSKRLNFYSTIHVEEPAIEALLQSQSLRRLQDVGMAGYARVFWPGLAGRKGVGNNS